MAPNARSRRRVNGEGSVYFSVSDNRWRGAYYDATGRRRTISRATRVAVAAELRAQTADRDRNVLGAAPGTIPTLDAWLEFWLRSKESHIRPSTLLGYHYSLKLVPDHLRRRRLDQLRPEYFEELYRTLVIDRHLSPNTVRTAHGALSQALKKAVRYGHLSTNPMTLLRPPPINRLEIIPLSLEETRKLLAACRDATARARWQIALLLGLRQGEALGVRWRDVDLDRGTLDVRQAVQYQVGKGLVIVKPKSRAGERTVYLPAPLVTALREHRTLHNLRRLAAGPAWHDTDLVFSNTTGQPVHPRDDSRHWKQLLAAAGVRRARLHDARHTAATLMFANHIEARTVMEILGHSQISHTLNIYTHVPTATMASAAQTLTAAVFGD